MTFSLELKAAFKNCRWAVEELVYDAKMTEANKLYSAGIKKVIWYLAEQYGGIDAAMARIDKLVASSGRKANKSDLSYEWAADEILYHRKEFEACRLMQSNNDMYAYLKRKYGSGRTVLNMISDMVLDQRHRCKSVAFRQHWFKSQEAI